LFTRECSPLWLVLLVRRLGCLCAVPSQARRAAIASASSHREQSATGSACQFCPPPTPRPPLSAVSAAPVLTGGRGPRAIRRPCAAASDWTVGLPRECVIPRRCRWRARLAARTSGDCCTSPRARLRSQTPSWPGGWMSD